MANMLQKIFGQIESKDQFDSLRITIASPEEILSWSHGEVKKPDTLDYKSMKPKPEGLFCQQIFGPVKDYECDCGKYKRIKFRGVICERCGVEVGSSSVRRKRMGHIKLAIPVSHIWFLKEGKISTLLNNLPQKKLELVVYYDAYIVIEPGLTNLKLYDVINEDEYQAAVDEFGADSFRVGIGAEGIRTIISELDMADEKIRLKNELSETKSEAKRKGLVKQLKLVESFLKSKTNPAWMLPDVLPVIPPDIRPLVPLDSGGVATSDLNDLYRRVIIRNNRLKKFMEMHAPEIIIRNEKRMLQEAVDSLFDNSHKARPMVSQNRRPLKSLSDSLRGKKGRFRMNMLGKRVDYSGRTVIVAGPTLKLHQVGLPKMMALELFKPFVYSRLMEGGYANTLKTARKMLENQEDIVFDILEKVIYQHPVLLNRAPTLHRLSILAFEPVLIEGKAIRLHPLVCKGFNADFDGDQMAVHVPISLEAQLEARTLMLSSNNILSPANGSPMIVPSQDMILGVHYMSLIDGEHTDKSPKFANVDEVLMALDKKVIKLQTPIVVRMNGKLWNTTAGRVKLGKLLPEDGSVPFDFVNKELVKKDFDTLLSETYERAGDKAMIVLADGLKDMGFEEAARSGISFGFDDILIPKEKEQIIKESRSIVLDIEKQYQNGFITDQERSDKITSLWQKTAVDLGEIAYENINKVIDDKRNSISMMARSGARGSKDQVKQLIAMRGVMYKPDGSLIELPIISNFKEGLTMAEYFISTHGARKGLSDTALKTADAGYLTRRLVDLAQNAVITEEDCGTDEFITVKPIYNGKELVINLGDAVLGRTVAQDVIDPNTNELIVKKGELVTKDIAKKINSIGLPSIDVRSVLTCKSDGLCAKCYGMDLSRSKLVHVGEAVGVVSGQSVGEPGTQLTLRTFHTGGVASGSSETHFIETPVKGKIRLKDVDLIKNSSGKTIVLSRNSSVEVVDDNGKELFSTNLPYSSILMVKDGDIIEKDAQIAETDPYSISIIAEKDGKVSFIDMIENVSFVEEVNALTGIVSRKVANWRNSTKKTLKPSISLVDESGNVIHVDDKRIASYTLPVNSILNVSDGDFIHAGDMLARTPVQIKRTGDITGGLPQVNNLLEVRTPANPALISDIDGTVELEDGKTKTIIKIIPESEGETYEYSVPKGTNLLVRDGDIVKKADKLVDGDLNPHDILRILGQKELARFMVNEVQKVYRSQGVSINDKHIEVLVREMTRRVDITDPGDTDFLTGQTVDRIDFEKENEQILSEGGTPAKSSQILVGLTKASLTSRSFISNASFQQTTKVLVDASIKGETDTLSGINENLIVGRLIPVGTGAYVRHIRDIAKKEEEEKLEKDNKQNLLSI